MPRWLNDWNAELEYDVFLLERGVSLADVKAIGDIHARARAEVAAARAGLRFRFNPSPSQPPPPAPSQEVADGVAGVLEHHRRGRRR